MSTTRTNHTAILLSNGRVLVTGGFVGSNGPSRTAELYDPVQNQWSPTGRMRAPRAQHTATLLPTGQALVVAGRGNWVTAEIYDPAAGTWSAAPELNEGRASHSATVLQDGRILVASGVDPDNAQLTSAELLEIDARPLIHRSGRGHRF